VVTVAGTNATDFTVTTSPSTNAAEPGSGSQLHLDRDLQACNDWSPSSVNQYRRQCPRQPAAVPLTGNPPIASVSTASLAFVSQPEGSLSPYQTVTLKNAAAYSPLTVSGISLSAGNFQQASNCPATLGALASCTVTIAFMPGATGTLTADLTFADNFSQQLCKQTECCAVGSRHGRACRKVVDDFRQLWNSSAREQKRASNRHANQYRRRNPNDFKPITYRS